MKNKNPTDIIEIEAEEIEAPLEKVIEKSLVKANVTEQVIASLKEKFGGMKLKSLDDKEGYIDIKEARKEVRKVGILTEKICKHGRKDANKIQKMWLAKEDEILSKIAEVQNPLDAEIKKFEDEKERRDKEESDRKEVIYINRQSTILKYGATYNNGSFDLGEISYEVSLLKDSDDETWERIILPKYRRVYEEKEAARVEEEIKRKEEMVRQEKERMEFEQKQAAFRKEQEEFEKQKREMQEQKDKQEREIREAEQEKQRQELAKKVALRNERVSELLNCGCHYDPVEESYLFSTTSLIGLPEIESISDSSWREFIAKTKVDVDKIKACEEEKKQAKIAEDICAAKELSAKQERERIAEEVRKEAIRKAEELAQSSDKEKYQDVIAYLKKTPIHEMKSSIYKSKMNVIRDFLSDIQSIK